MKSKFFKYHKKQSKYGNKKTEYNGVMFDSKKEAEYCATLDILKKASKKEDRVTSYERQVPFQITLNKKKICKYFADFKVLYADGREEIIDVKGVKTDVYKIKKATPSTIIIESWRALLLHFVFHSNYKMCGKVLKISC